MSNIKHRPFFISLEGGEGTGKSTVVERLSKELQSRGFGVLATREPGGAQLGEQIRLWLLNQKENLIIGDRAELLLFLAARAQHLEELILPALAKGYVVLCDRFNDSTIAYQGAARGLGVEAVEEQCMFACGGISPDLTLFMDVEPAIGLKRTRAAGKTLASEGKFDRIESEQLGFHEKVLFAMRHLLEKYPQRIKRIDASRTLEEVYQECLKTVVAALENG